MNEKIDLLISDHRDPLFQWKLVPFFIFQNSIKPVVSPFLSYNKFQTASILTLLWNPEVDEMSFVQRTIPETETTTKRSILKQTSRIYDPLGLLSPVTVWAKLLVQDLWKQKYDWDTSLPEDIVDTWADVCRLCRCIFSVGLIMAP